MQDVLNLKNMLVRLDALKRAIIIVRVLNREKNMGLVRLAQTLSEPVHKVRYAVRILEESGIVQSSFDSATFNGGMGRSLQSGVFNPPMATSPFYSLSPKLKMAYDMVNMMEIKVKEIKNLLEIEG